MDQSQKDRLHHQATAHIVETTQTIGALVEKLDKTLGDGPGTFYSSESETAFEDQVRALATQTNTAFIRQEMTELAASPYFSRLDLAFDDEPQRPYYIAKYSASELGIYSWTAPIAALRFEDPGIVSYQTPHRVKRTGTLNRKDQYMIARGHLNFMTTEAQDTPRELIYQEHFSTRKTGFVLPEVVAQMEKAQDQVIRAAHRGSFAISGPAGSGKTTLALHRVAFLRQSPETTTKYPAESVLVLVQDVGTEDYFSHLLPELGIHDVQITTFARWAIAQLGLGQYFYHARPGRSELERDSYEYAKLQGLRGALPEAGMAELKKPNKLLLRHYQNYLNESQLALLAEELQEGALDRFDLTLLLMLRRQHEGQLTTIVEDLIYRGPGKVDRSSKVVPLEYSLLLIDEFQNYLPEQLRLLKSTTGKLGSMLYVGDLAQQTQFGTLQAWSEIGEVIAPDRAITLEKVYRNTRQILEYVGSLGYTVDIPAGVAEGPAVVEHPARDVMEALQYIVSLTRPPGSQLGIIAKDPAELGTYIDYFAADPSVRCMTMREAQGVEFEIVCLLNIIEPQPSAGELEADFVTELARIERDLLYVALTRAMTELHVIGHSLATG